MTLYSPFFCLFRNDGCMDRVMGQELTWDGYIAWKESNFGSRGSRFEQERVSPPHRHDPPSQSQPQPQPQPPSHSESISSSSSEPVPAPGTEPKSQPRETDGGGIGMDDAPLPMSFSAIAELISTGNVHLIPNNKVIPDRLNVRSSTSYDYPPQQIEES